MSAAPPSASPAMPCARRSCRTRSSTSGSAGGCCSNARTCSAPARSSSAAPTTRSPRSRREVARARRRRHVVGQPCPGRGRGGAPLRRRAPPSSCRPTRRRPSGCRTERSGARIVTYDRASEDRDAVAARFIAEHGGTLIHPFNNADVIAGQGTVGLEIAADCAADGLRARCGAGAGQRRRPVGRHRPCRARAASPEAEIVLVEPEGFDDYGRSLAAGRDRRQPALGRLGLRCAADRPARRASASPSTGHTPPPASRSATRRRSPPSPSPSAS